MKLVKAEILWSRTCSLSCSYCGMADGRRNNLSLNQWKEGIDNLKALECGFIAFYGAEPLEEFEKLPEVVGYAESLGIHTTIITSGVVKDFFTKIKVLRDAGAQSLSMSYDIVGLNSSSRIKAKQVLSALDYFRSLGSFRDVAAISTLTRTNFRLFPHSVIEMSQRGIWSFFDLIHWDRGQPGSKCRNYFGMKDLLFRQEDTRNFLFFLDDLVNLKKSKFFCHTSFGFMDLLSSNPKLLATYNWNCALSDAFPSWVTVDCDGLVYPCDDFQIRPGKILLLDLFVRWDEFSNQSRQQVKERCPGCLWNTHIDAHAIKEGKLSFSDYVHRGDI